MKESLDQHAAQSAPSASGSRHDGQSGGRAMSRTARHPAPQASLTRFACDLQPPAISSIVQ
jgi:hypothetical protein